MNRNTSQRDRDRATIARTKPPCALCGTDIDYELPYLHPQSYVVDHITPIQAGGPDTLENKQASHRACNRTKGARLDGGPTLRRSGTLNRRTP